MKHNGVNRHVLQIARRCHEGAAIPLRHFSPHKECGVEAHIFLRVSAHHLLTAIEKTLLDARANTSWATGAGAVEDAPGEHHRVAGRR
jgi:hypothetical protein